MDAGFPLLPPPDWWKPGVDDGAGESAKEGEYIRYAAPTLGDLDSPHSDEDAPEQLRGKASEVDVSEITKEWVLQRLVKEANDFGSRTRQSSRVKALQLIGESLSMFVEVVEHRDPVREALKGMDPIERKQRILELASQLANDPNLASKVASNIAG